MEKGSTVVYKGGSDLDSLRVGEQYEVLDYSDYRNQVKLVDEDGDTVWVSEHSVEEV